MDWLELLRLAGAAGIGSVIATWMGGGKERRDVRASALKALTVTESKRRASDPDGNDFGEFVQAVRDLEVAALGAMINTCG